MMMPGEALSARYFFSSETSPKGHEHSALPGSLSLANSSWQPGQAFPVDVWCCLSSRDLVIFTDAYTLSCTTLFLLDARSPCCFYLPLLAIYSFIFVYHILHKFIQNLKPRYHRSFSRPSRTPRWDKSSAS